MGISLPPVVSYRVPTGSSWFIPRYIISAKVLLRVHTGKDIYGDSLLTIMMITGHLLDLSRFLLVSSQIHDDHDAEFRNITLPKSLFFLALNNVNTANMTGWNRGIGLLLLRRRFLRKRNRWSWSSILKFYYLVRSKSCSKS